MTNEVAFYSYKEMVLVPKYPDEVFVVVRTKHYTVPSGGQGWQYLLQNEKGVNLPDWVNQQDIKKLLVGSSYTFEGLMTILKDVVERDDFQ